MYKTKADLQVELRQYMKSAGFGRLPISNMKKHELEANLYAAQKMKAEMEAKAAELGPAPRTKPPSRPIPTVSVEMDGEDTITVPGQPPVRLTKAPLVNKPKKPKEPKEPKEPKADAPVKEEPARPLKEKSVAKVYCSCNCPSCPNK